ncbi:uncharacterized protein N7446_000107 [Penicillium canescens]|uniref:Uncharacterized protein n=1 Tax=Penicillium canescens TaxID=5083 RepID=A0AAD6I563_PENCN|nr:uncharacterized protein N7446_000107 [Penicillium canescens]KAJ6030826.1 hypothetical protein N7460_011092 [Penicillium canescens]KAJ6059456.1 hypothetical protein N7444_003095 [Penicillium canescens]KAJ6077171.1 hypothetical protein N7446_000107 [Penicillium canescens]
MTEKISTLDLESNKLEYDPWLLEDHPLRSHPTECIPGLSPYLYGIYQSLSLSKAFVRAAALVLGCLAAFQCFRLLPLNLPKELPHTASASSTHTHAQPSACTFPTLDTRPQALKKALEGGCDGLRTAIWMYDGELQIGNAVGSPDPNGFLDRLGLDPLLAKLDKEAEDSQSPLNPETPVIFHADLSRTFLLMLDAKTSLHELYPLLVEQLDRLRQRGYISHWDGESVVQRPVTVVVTGEAFPESDCASHSYSDIFWSALPEGRFTTSDFTKDGLRHLSPICIA